MIKKQKLVVVGCGMASGKFIEELIIRDRVKSIYSKS